MKAHLMRRIPTAVAMGLAVATLALVFLAAIGVRSLVVRTASASPGAPTPVGHEWSQVENHGTSGAPIDTYWLGTTGNEALALKTNGAQRVTVTGDGKVGIGTTAPGENLHIAAVEPGIVWETTGAATDEKKWSVDSFGNQWRLFAANDALNFWHEAIRVTRSGPFVSSIAFPHGNVAIGSADANARLQVNGGDAYIRDQGSGIILRATDGSNCYRLTVNNAGAVTTTLLSCP